MRRLMWVTLAIGLCAFDWRATERPEGQRVLVWVHPISSLIFATNAASLLPYSRTNALLGPQGVYVSGGIEVRLRDDFGILAEGAGFTGKQENGSDSARRIFNSAQVVVGAAWYPLEGRGFFLSPRFILLTSHDLSLTQDAGARLPPRNDSVELSLGCDVGWQLRVGPIYGAVILGASFGYCISCPQAVPPSGFWSIGPNQSDRLTWGLTMHLLRLGVTL